MLKALLKQSYSSFVSRTSGLASLDEVCFFIYSNEGYFKVFSPRAPPGSPGMGGWGYIHKNVKTHSLNNS